MARMPSGNIESGDENVGPVTQKPLPKYRRPQHKPQAQSKSQSKPRTPNANRSTFVDNDEGDDDRHSGSTGNGNSRDSQTLRDSQTIQDAHHIQDDEYDDYEEYEPDTQRRRGDEDELEEEHNSDEHNSDEQDSDEQHSDNTLRMPNKERRDLTTDEAQARTALPKAFEFLQSVPAQNDETEDDYLLRVQTELHKLSGRGSESRKIQISDLPNPRSGSNDMMGETWGPAVERLTSNVRDSVRVSLLLDLNSTSVDALLAFAMKTLDWPQDVRSYAFFMIRKRMKSNLSSWKHRALKSLKEYISGIIDEDDEGDFANEKELARLQRFLERRFNIDTFVQIFDWVKPVIDLHGSSDKLRTWCTILFAELGAYAKRHIDWQRDPNSRESDPFNTANFLNRFDVLADIPQLQSFKPKRSDVKIIQTVKKSTPTKKQDKRGLTDHLNDPYVFIPQTKKPKHT